MNFLLFFERALRAGVTRRWWGVVDVRRRTEPFRQHGFQGIRPDLIRLERWMKLIGVHHARKQSAFFIRELVVDIEVSDSSTIGHLRKVAIDLMDRWNHRHAVIAREDCGHDDSCGWGLGLTLLKKRP